jgi:hypothetical protein
MELSVPTSLGDALDRLTILRIKTRKILDPQKQANVRREAEAIARAWNAAGLPFPEEVPEFSSLEAVNEALWEVEDSLRLLESRSDFGPEFVRLARSVYVTNDQRAALKRAVNQRFGSTLMEEKQHPSYQS